MNEKSLLIVFAKAPVPGFAKTRLARTIGFEAAASLAGRMLTHTLASAIASSIGPVELCCAPDVTHEQFQLAGVSLSAQGDGNLGERMARSFARGLENYRRVVLIGTDAPMLDASVLRAAAAALKSHDAVIAPAHDGGYVLVGLSQPAPGIFQEIEWSSSRVMAQTRMRIASMKLSLYELPALHDIDEPEDLLHLPPGWLA